MKSPEKIRALEGLLARVQRNAGQPRAVPQAQPAHHVHDAPTVDRKQDLPGAKPAPHDPFALSPAAKAQPAKVELAKVELVKAEPAKAEPAKAEPAKAEPAKAEPAKAEPPKAQPAKAEASDRSRSETARMALDDAPITRADPSSELIARESEELEELGPADEAPSSSSNAKVVFADEPTRPADEVRPVAAAAPAIAASPPVAIGSADELEVLDEEDVIDGSPAPAKVEAVPEPPPARPQLRSVPPPLPAQKPSDRPRSIPPPFPGVGKPAKNESLEADVPLRTQPVGPTPEQLGGLIELEEGPPTNFELAPVAAPKGEEEPAEDEAVLPRAVSPGQFTAPRPSSPVDLAEPPPAAAVVAAIAPEAAPALAQEAPVVAIVAKLDVPPSPAIVAAPAAPSAPAPVDVSIAPQAAARAVMSGEVARFVTAAKREPSSTFGALLDATLRLGT